MKAVMLRTSAELRARLPSMVALALLLGLGAASIMTMAAGARRSDSAYPRFARQYKAADMLVYPKFDESFADLDFAVVSKIPQIAAAARERYLFAADYSNGLAVISEADGLGVTVNRVKILEGRMPRPDRLDEAAVSFQLAKDHRFRVGSVLTLHFGTYTRDQIPVRLKVVGIEASPGEFPPQIANSSPGQGGFVRISHALYESLVRRKVFGLDFQILRFRRGAADFGAVNDRLNGLAKGKVQINQNLGAQAANVQRSIHLQAVALRIVGGLVALIGALVLSQLIARQAALDAAEAPTLLGLGMTRSQIALSSLTRYALIGVAGGVVGVAGAFLASPLMPIGTARIAEPNTGLSFDAIVLGLGSLGTIAGFLALAAWPLWKSARGTVRERAASTQPSLVARSASLGIVPPQVGTGVRLALGAGRGRTAVPVRSSLLSVALAIAALAAALTFGAGLDHLLDTPRQYGWGWDLHATSTADSETAQTPKPALAALLPDPDISSIALVDNPPVQIGKVRFDAIAFQQQKGAVQPVMIEGHAPRAADEIVLGVRTLREVHARIGEKVSVSISAIEGVSASFTVVGTAVIPPSSDTTRLGSGGVITYEGEKRMAPPDFHDFPPVTEIYLRLAPGVDRRAALERIGKALDGASYETILPTRPGDLVNFGQVQNLPLVLAGLVGILAAATLAHTLVTSIRRRRRDLAILKLLGFVPRQVRSAVAWQGTTFVCAALLIGLPVGIVLGRLIWIVFTRQLGTLAEPVTPSLQLLLTVPGAIVLANLIAAVPGVIAGRMKPAPALRAE